jgi:hypothetical protein
MRSFVFIALACAAFFVVVMAGRLIKENPFDQKQASSSSSEDGGFALDADSLARCLSTRGALLFGADWCPACRHQNELFGSAASYLEHVDCDESPTACADAGVRSIPAWEIGGRLHTGVQSLDSLADLSGCRGEATAQGAQQALLELPEIEDWEVSELSYSWRDAKGGFHVTTEAPPRGATEVEIFR